MTVNFYRKELNVILLPNKCTITTRYKTFPLTVLINPGYIFKRIYEKSNITQIHQNIQQNINKFLCNQDIGYLYLKDTLGLK